MTRCVVQKITLLVDTEWGDAIAKFTDLVPLGQVCEWVDWSNPYMYEVDDGYEEEE